MNIPTASMKCVFTLPVLLFAWFAFPGLCMAQGSVAEDKAALQALYNATNGDNWTTDTNWNSTEPLHQWHGVRVDSRTGRVTIIGLANNNLNGSIPVEIGDLTALKVLSLYNNALTGEIPSSIGDLTALESLHLSYNDLTGEIPSSIVDLTALKVLSLYNNTLTGEIPSSIGDLTALEELWLTDNDLTGGIPSSIGDLTALKKLALALNDLTGEIPSSIFDLTALESLRLYGNDLTGGIPSSIGDLTALESLLLSSNDLTGEIPSSIGDLTALENLHLNDNALTGEIPESFSNLVNLSTFYAGGTNNVCIPSGLQSWHNGISQRDSLPECASSPPSPTVSVTPETLSVTEDAGSAQLTLELSEVLSDPVTVDWATSDGTAAAGSDYTAGDGTVNFAPNETRKTIDIAITDDALDESDETFTVTLSNPSNTELGTAKTATVTIADNDVRGVAISPTTLTITEGAGKTYEVVLNTQPTGDVTVTPSLATGSDADVTLASSAALTFTSLNWDTVQTVTVNAAEDNDAAPGVATIEHAVAGADYAGVTASDVTVTIADNDVRGVAISPTTLTITEGASKTYEVVLNTQPTGDVTVTPSLATGSDADVTLASSSAFTFTSLNWNVAQEVTVNVAEDNDAAPGVATIEHAVAGADYAGVTASDVTVTIADNDVRGVAISPTTLTITEGAGKTYEVVLNTQPTGDVTVTPSLATGSDADVTLASSAALTFTSLNWDTVQTVTVNAAEDNDAAPGVATIEHAVAGADYAGVTASDVTVTIADNDVRGVAISPTTLTITEGASKTYEVVLNTQPTGDVTVTPSLATGSDADVTLASSSAFTFTSLNWNVAQRVTVNVAEDNDAAPGVATIEHAVAGADYAGVTASDVTVTEADNDVRGVAISPTTLTITEGAGKTYEVVLNTQPTGDVTVTPSLATGSDADVTLASSAALTFTSLNWNTAQRVTVNAAEDNDALNGEATIEHAVAGADYAGVTASDVTVTEADNDVRGVAISPTTLTIAKGASKTYEVVLNTQPTGDVTVTPSLATGSDADVTLASSSALTFTMLNWNVAQRVTVNAAEDNDAAPGVATIEHAVAGADYAGVTASDVTVTEADNDNAAAGVTVTPTALTVAEGSSATYTVVLDTEPSADVTIAVSFAAGSDVDITVDKTSLTFTTDNWDAAQEITVSAAEDDDATDGTATIAHTASGGGYGGVSVSSITATEADNDAAGVTVTPTALSVPEGSNARYTVALDARPSADVTISLSFASGSDADITVDKTLLTFTMDNWSTAQEITVSAAEDDDATDGTATIAHTASGGGYGGVSVSSITATEADNDAAGVTVTPTALSVPEGSNARYAVVLDTQPSEDVTIAVSFASGSDADITVDKTSLTFTPDNWSTAQEITVSAAEDDDATDGTATIAHTASGGGYGGVSVSSITATEADNDAAGVTVTPTALTVTEGSNAKYTVVLDTQPSDDVTIAVSFASGSDEDITVDKTSLSFTPDNWSMTQEVTVTAAVDNDIEDDAAVLNHKASGGDYGEVTIADVVVTVTDVIGGVDVSAWLARYSRVGADHLLSSVENRMESIDRGASGAGASIAGQRIVFGNSPARPGMELSGASAIWSASQSYTTSSLGSDRSDMRLRNSYGMSSGLNAAARRYSNMTLRDALSRSAFRYAREMSSGNSFGVWGQGSFSRFSGSEAGADMDGDVMSGTVGVDNSFSGWLHGLAVSRSESEGAYRVAGKDSLSLSASLTGIYPYARYNLTDRLRVWGTGGYGRGSLRLQGDSLASSSSDLSMVLGSIGVSGDIVSAGSSGGFGLSWQTDAMLLRSSLASSRSLSSVEAMVHRLRLSLESSYTLRMGNRASLAPKVQLGVRQDGGDAEQGMGMDVAGGLGFIHSGWGLRAQVDMHGLVVHEDSDFEEWGVSGMILFDRSPSLDIGASLRLFPSWGSASSSTGGMRALWSRETVSGLAGFRRTGSDDRSLRLAGRFDYGFAAFGEHGVASPYASFSVSGNEAARAAGDTDVEIGGGLGYSNRSLGLRMRAGMRGLMSEEEVGFDRWGASSGVFFDPDPSSPLGASFNVSQSWGITPRTGFGGSQNMGTMHEREPLPRSVTGISRSNLYGQPMRIEGEMGYGFSASGGAGVMTPYAGVAFSEQGRSGLLLGFNLHAGKRFLLNLEGSTPRVRAISFDSTPEFRVRGLLKW